jgi:hypothetical protein
MPDTRGRAAMPFKLGRRYSRREISSKLGGSPVAYLPFTGNEVVCGCFRQDYNPDAPGEVIYGEGPDVEKSAEMVARQTDPIPVFLHRAASAWEYLGLYRCCGHKADAATLRQVRKRYPDQRKIVGVLYFKPEPDRRR